MRYLTLFIALVASFSLKVTAQGHYHFSVDLTTCKNDKLTVELEVPEIHTKEVIYRIPKIVPGTYEIYNFGRLASDFTALDEEGKELNVDQLDKNSWKITEADRLKKITYKVEDS